ncbi:MAG: hypothetical protein J0L78_00630 [Planctomycetes bacterium]|nr:hypothetical protein [Planctomycetota bacterium]
MEYSAMMSVAARFGKVWVAAALLLASLVSVPQAAAQDAAPTRIYVIDLNGEFGYDISQTPIRQAMRDARNQNADVVIVKIDAKWERDELTPLPDTEQRFNELFRAQKILPIFADEMNREWPKVPRVVMWVKRAMGGPAFIPFVAPEIYFTADGKMGGVGGIGTMLEGRGDEVVRQKQYSLRMARAEGFLIRGGYDPIIVRAMCQPGFLLTYRMEGGKPIFFERAPERPDEFALTSGEKGDSMQAIVRGTTKSVLTLDADVARAINVSKGTADTLDDLIFQLNLSRNSTIIEGQSKRYMENWKRDLNNATKEIKKTLEEMGPMQEGGGGSGAGNTYEARTQARGKQIRQLDSIINKLKTYEEAFGPRWRQENQVPAIGQLLAQREQLELQQLLDKK